MVQFNPYGVFPVVTNIFYVIPLTLAWYYTWYYLFFLYLAVIFTSTSYHVCENLDSCLFGWSIKEWRILDHIFAFCAIVTTLIYVFNPEFYTSKKAKMYKIWWFKSKKTTSLAYNFWLSFTNVLLLIEIIYFSTTMVDAFPVPQLVIGLSTFVCLIICRILRVVGFKNNFFCPKQVNVAIFGSSLLFLAFGILTFMMPEDPDGILHGLWHFFSSLSGGLLLMSVLLMIVYVSKVNTKK